MKSSEVQTMLGVAYADLEILRNKGHLKASRQGNGHYDYTAESVRNCVVNLREVKNILYRAKNSVSPTIMSAQTVVRQQNVSVSCHRGCH